MTLDEFHADLQAFRTLQSADEVRAHCARHSRALGFDTFIYAVRVPRHFTDSRLLMVQGYPAGWVEHYFASGYQSVDPVMRHCAQHVTPVQWHELHTEPRGASRRMMDEAGEFGLRSGLSMPVHSPHGELGVLSFSVDRPAQAARALTEFAKPRVQLMAGYLHETLRRVWRVDDEPSQAMTERERECLRWVADGKSSWEIARLLRLSERTVNFHLGRVMHKLGVSNRQHAVAKAALRGLLHPHPF